MSTHRAVRFTAFGPPDVLEVVTDVPVPEPGPGEVRVRVEASSVQFTDTLIRRGQYPDLKDPPPVTPGYDLVGRVDALGEGVDTVAVGDRVADLIMVGGNARFAIRPAAGLVAVPDDVDAAEAVTLVLSWLTAQQALFRHGMLKAGERLLIIGGNGAVGIAAIRLAQLCGAEVFATASATHHEALRALGATPLPREGWQDAVAQLGGVDVVLDGVCADGYRSAHAALRTGGRLVAIGFSAVSDSVPTILMAFARIGLWRWFTRRTQASFYSITKMRARHTDWFAADLGALFAQLQRGEIRPRISERLTLDDVAGAHARLEAGGLWGKLVLDPWAAAAA